MPVSYWVHPAGLVRVPVSTEYQKMTARSFAAQPVGGPVNVRVVELAAACRDAT